jgi:hypothetical protein
VPANSLSPLPLPTVTNSSLLAPLDEFPPPKATPQRLLRTCWGFAGTKTDFLRSVELLTLTRRALKLLIGGLSARPHVKAAEGPAIELRQTPLSTERVRRALLLLPLFQTFVYVLRVLEVYSLSYVASILNVDKDACQAALAYSFGAFAQALTPVQLARQQ